MRPHCHYFIILCSSSEVILCSSYQLVLEILPCLLRENVCDIACKSKVYKISEFVIVFHVKDRNDDDDIASISIDMQVHRGSHHLADIHFSGNAFV